MTKMKKKILGLFLTGILVGSGVFVVAQETGLKEFRANYEGPSCLISAKDGDSFEEMAFKAISRSSRTYVDENSWMTMNNIYILGIVMEDVLDEKGVPLANLGEKMG